MVLRVRLEVVPMGDESATREIGRLEIFNMEPYVEDPAYGVIDLSPGHVGLYEKAVRHMRVLGAWQLVRKVLSVLPVEGP